MTVDIDQKKILSNSIQKLVKEKKDPDLELKISKTETKTKEITILFPKKISY